MISALELVQFSNYSSSYLNMLWLHYFCYEQYLKITGFKTGSSSYFQYASFEGDIFICVCHLLFANDEKVLGA